MLWRVVGLLFATQILFSQELRLPARLPSAPGGAAFAKSLEGAALQRREELVLQQITEGNVPTFLRKLAPVPFGSSNCMIFVTPDYLAVGSDEDYFRVPLTAFAAQRAADLLDCVLPTPGMVDAIYFAAGVKFTPTNLPPDATMTTVPVFWRHHELIEQQRRAFPSASGGLAAGHKKDVVLPPAGTAPSKVVIYGWHKPDGRPIQPVYAGHAASWVDYSHGTRLVSKKALLDGKVIETDSLLTNYLSRYATFPEFAKGLAPIEDERSGPIDLAFGVKGWINAPLTFAPGAAVHLVLYFLPNGNSIEQSRGRRVGSTNEWPFDNQHIDAQARFLRKRAGETNLVLIYLEAPGKSWPAWRREHGEDHEHIPMLWKQVTSLFADLPRRVTLTAHSGGGALIFGLIDGWDEIPAGIERIGFLDANYAFDPTGAQTRKFGRWLRADARHHLVVVAYDDASARLNGKPFVSAAGGTWGKSHAMLDAFRRDFDFRSSKSGALETDTALEGQLRLLLRENPEAKIWHTVLVEKNGFIHALLAGTRREAKEYEFLGERAYSEFIRD